MRGKIDSNGVATALLEERLSMGLNFLLSAEVHNDLLLRYPLFLYQFSPFKTLVLFFSIQLDHKKKDYKFGFGLTVG